MRHQIVHSFLSVFHFRGCEMGTQNNIGDHSDIAPRVEKAALGFGEQQQPQYGQLQFSGHVGGDFVFVPKG